MRPVSFQVVLPLPARTVSPNAHYGHWGQRHRATKGARCAAGWHFKRAKPMAWGGADPVDLEVRYHCPFGARGYSPRDVQNAIAALKPAVDGMVDAGIVPDDSAKWVSWGRVQVTRDGADAPGVYVTVSIRGVAVQATEEVTSEQEGDRHGRATEALG